ncbi:7607_t:CDS:1, partial [Acaulospora morrowiae]
LVASAFSSILDSPVVTYDEYVERGETVLPQQVLSIDSVHKSFLVTEEDIARHSTLADNPVEKDNVKLDISSPRSSLLFSKVDGLPISPTINRHGNLYQSISRQIDTSMPSIGGKPFAPPPPPRNTPRNSIMSSPQPPDQSRQIQIFVSTLNSEQRGILINSNATVFQLKHEIYLLFGYDIPCQRLIFSGKQLSNERTLSSYDIQHSSTIHIVFRLSGGLDCYIVTSDLLNSKYDFDFTNVYDKGQTYMRGNHLYKRPCGWKRLALNVSSRYGSNDWLGVNVKRRSMTESVKGEWPVSYHGTLKDNANNIADKGYLLDMGKRFLYGKGIYSSPDIEVAARFAKVFTHEGINYKVVFQNRINPNNMKKITPEQTGIGEYWISSNEHDIRPYGLCFKRV